MTKIGFTGKKQLANLLACFFRPLCALRTIAMLCLQLQVATLKIASACLPEKPFCITTRPLVRGLLCGALGFSVWVCDCAKVVTAVDFFFSVCVFVCVCVCGNSLCPMEACEGLCEEGNSYLLSARCAREREGQVGGRPLEGSVGWSGLVWVGWGDAGVFERFDSVLRRQRVHLF